MGDKNTNNAKINVDLAKMIEENTSKTNDMKNSLVELQSFLGDLKSIFNEKKNELRSKLFGESEIVVEEPVVEVSEPVVEEKPVKEEVVQPVVETKPAAKTVITYIPKQSNTQYNKPREQHNGNRYDTTPYSKPPIRKPVAPIASVEINQNNNKNFKVDDKKKSQIPNTNLDDKKRLNKKAKIQKGYEKNVGVIEYDEISGEITKIRGRRNSSNDKKRAFTPTAIVIENAVMTTETITIKNLSEKIGKTGVEIIKKLFEIGIMKSINDNIDFDTAELVSAEFGVTLELKLEKTSEEKLFAFHEDDNIIEDASSLEERPPIVTIMGHVDHGKTSVLDYIRKSQVASGEAGGITQHIGAYTIELNDKQITFLDTPGHAAFTSMRARGANVTDIVVIVVAADDGIMPQTIEAINHAKAADVSIIVAINKMDKPTANPDKILQQLADHELLVEEWGGLIPAVKVSAKTGLGINSLLENIILTAEILELKANPNRSAKGTIVESKLDKGKGPMATVLVQNGTLSVGDFIVAGTTIGRVRAMFDDKGKQTTKAGPSTPVSILGLQAVPNAGDQIMVVKDEKLSKQVVEERKNREKIDQLKTHKMTLEDVFSKLEEGKTKNLNLILKADVQGSEEAIKQSLIKLSNEEVKVNVIHSGVGAVNETDVTLADTSNSIIIGFNIRPDANARALAEKQKIQIKLYRVIYDAINDITLAVKGLLAPTYEEKYLGRAEVRQVFKISSIGTIAGCMVKDGKIARNAKVRLLRDGVVITETEIASLKRMKDDVKEVVSGYDCGIGLEKYNDLRENDVIEAYVVEEVR